MKIWLLILFLLRNKFHAKHFLQVSRLKLRSFKQFMALDTVNNCQRPVLSLGVFRHMHQITNLWKFWFNWSSKLQENNERKKKHPCCILILCALRCIIKGFAAEVCFHFSEKLPLFQKQCYFVSNNVLYYQQLSTVILSNKQ